MPSAANPRQPSIVRSSASIVSSGIVVGISTLDDPIRPASQDRDTFLVPPVDAKGSGGSSRQFRSQRRGVDPAQHRDKTVKPGGVKRAKMRCSSSSAFGATSA